MFTDKYNHRFPLRHWCASYANENCANHHVAFLALALEKLREKPDAQFIIIMFKMKHSGFYVLSFYFYLYFL